MHLLVLGAFGLRIKDEENLMLESLNAPSGAGCFRTTKCRHCSATLYVVLMHLLVLGAFGRPPAQDQGVHGWVLMHLLVLGAF